MKKAAWKGMESGGLRAYKVLLEINIMQEIRFALGHQQSYLEGKSTRYST